MLINSCEKCLGDNFQFFFLLNLQIGFIWNNCLFKLRHALTSRWCSRNETKVSRDKSKHGKLRVVIHKNIEKPAKSLSVVRGVQTQFVRCTLFRLFIKFDLTLHPSSWIYHTALFSTIFSLFICKYKTRVYAYSNFFYFEIGYYPPRLLNG